MTLQVKFIDSVAAGNNPVQTLTNLDIHNGEIQQTIQNVASGVQANPETGEITLAGETFSIYQNLNQNDKSRARQLADKTVVNQDNGRTISLFGIAEQEKMSQLVDKVLGFTSQFGLDEALTATTDQLTTIVDTGLNLELIYQDDQSGLEKWIDKTFPYFKKLNVFLRKVQSIRSRLEAIRKALKLQDSQILERINITDQMGDEYETSIDRFYIFAAACELIFKREVDTLNQMIKDASAAPNDARLTVKVQRQKTIVIATMTRMFYMLSQAINSFLKVNILEESLRGAVMAHQSVIEAVYGAIDDLKQSIATILNTYRTAQTHQRALQVNHAALEALKKVVEQGKVTNAMLQKMSDEQKAAVGTYYGVKDTLVENIRIANQIFAGMRDNYQLLVKANDDVTQAITNALKETTV